jgi:phosphate transport system substrate-binding protein
MVAAVATAAPVTAAALRVNGSTTVAPVVTRAAEILAKEQGEEVVVDTQGGSSGGIAALGDRRADVAMASRPLNDDDRRKYPQVDFTPTTVAVDALALVVSSDVWEAGVKALSREQVQAIYEKRIQNWKEVGGPDRRIAFFNKEPGRGTWEVFAHWLYGDAKQAPLVSHPEVGANEEARNKVRATRGAMSQLSVAWADGKTLYALGIRLADGTVVKPTPAELAAERYPLARPLLVVTDGPPEGTARRLFDFLLSPRGQELVREAGFLDRGQAGVTGR